MRSAIEVSYVLHLKEDEARLLKNLVQNPLSADEPYEITKLREAIFNALQIFEQQGPSASPGAPRIAAWDFSPLV